MYQHTRINVMEYWSRERKVIYISSLILFLCILLGTAFYAIFAPTFIVSMYKGESLDFLNDLVRNRPPRPLESYFLYGRIIFSRILLICLAIYLVVIVSLLPRQIFSLLREFFTTPTTPINLAVFRIIFFSTLLHEAGKLQEIIWYSQVPSDFQFPPKGLGWLLASFPINEASIQISSSFLVVVCYTGMIGLFSRTSALMAAVLAFYVLGIPQLYGKVDHNHYFLWFAALLAASRCGDALSCDAIFSGWRQTNRSVTGPPGPSQVYTMPLRFVQLLLGVMYFFPGFWKFWNAGMDWAFSDNLKYQLYSKWMEVGEWTPLFRLDLYPTLYQLGALATIIFEISFIFLIFSSKLKYLAVIGGIFFHKMTHIFMDIFFSDLIKYYVVFFDWNNIFGRIGSWIYKKDMYVVYDGSCKLCRRTIASIRVFDVLGRIVYINGLDKEAMRSHGFSQWDPALLMADMHVIVQGKIWVGFAAYRALITRLPLLWPFLPFLYLWPITTLGHRIYRSVADSRLCRIMPVPSLPHMASGETSQRWVSAAIVIGSMLFVANTYYGFRGIGDSWPFACFPTFAWLDGPETTSLEMSVLNAAGVVIPLQEETLRSAFSPARFRHLLGRILNTEDPERRRMRLVALWQLWARHDVSLQQATTIRFYRVLLSTIPERRKENPLNRELLFELNVQLNHADNAG